MSARVIGRLAGIGCATGGFAFAWFAAAPLVEVCCAGGAARTRDTLETAVFFVCVALAAGIGSAIAPPRDPSPAIVLTLLSVLAALLGLAFSAVESGNVRTTENLVLGGAGILASWLGYFAARLAAERSR